MKAENKTDTLKATGREQSPEKIVIVGLLLISLALFSVLKLKLTESREKRCLVLPLFISPLANILNTPLLVIHR